MPGAKWGVCVALLFFYPVALNAQIWLMWENASHIIHALCEIWHSITQTTQWDSEIPRLKCSVSVSAQKAFSKISFFFFFYSLNFLSDRPHQRLRVSPQFITRCPTLYLMKSLIHNVCMHIAVFAGCQRDFGSSVGLPQGWEAKLPHLFWLSLYFGARPCTMILPSNYITRGRLGSLREVAQGLIGKAR